jgi:lipopolysaccharide export system ATP-binding protein
MTAPAWLAPLADRDLTLPLALAALVQGADADGGMDFSELALGFRNVFQTCYQEVSGAAQELSAEELHANLNGSVLPRLASEGWIAGPEEGTWTLVRATGPWWTEAAADRDGSVGRLLALGRVGFRRGLRMTGSFTLHQGSVLEGRELSKSFHRRRVVNEVSVRVEQGEIVGLLGPNGAGKTTTFYLITGLIRPDHGTVTLDGKDLTRAPMYRRARQGIGYLAQEPSVFRKLTVEENVLAILETLAISKEERRRRLEVLLDELSIKHLRKVKAYALSGGERRRLEITRALVTQPKFMLLDEPFAGVDPIAVHEIQTIVAGLRHRGIGVLITDHNVEQTFDIVDRAYIMFEGKVQVSGSVRDLVFDDNVAQLYLGPTLSSRLRARLEAVA